MPAKITLAGEKIYKSYMRHSRLQFAQINTYQTNAPRDGGRKSVEDVDSWAQPLCQSIIAITILLEFSNLILKDSEYSGS